MKLLEGSLIHHVFHVSLLKKKWERKVVSARLLVIDEGGRVKVFPFVVLDRKIMKKWNKATILDMI